MKFKGGDRVRIVGVSEDSTCKECKLKYIGRIYTIDENIKYNFPFPYDFKDNDTGLFWCDEELEFVTFTKADLKDGMVVEHRNGDRDMVLNGDFIGLDFYYLYYKENFTDNLMNIKGISDLDIVKVYRPASVTSLKNYFNDAFLELIWERKEEPVKKMTIEEIEKQLGYKIRIVETK